MFNAVIISSILIGVILIWISGLQKILLLFIGLGIILFAITSLVIKRNSRYFILLSIILLIFGLYQFNAMDFRANSFSIDFYRAEGYTVHLYYKGPENTVDDQITPEMAAASTHILNEDDRFKFVFEPQFALKGSDFFLVDYFRDNDLMEATWLWVNEEPNAKISSSKTTLKDNQVQDDNYESGTPLNINWDRINLIMEIQPDPNNATYEVFVNEEKLTLDRVQENYFYYSSNKPVGKIIRIQIVETTHSSPYDVIRLRPKITALYLNAKNPDPIIIHQINLYKYLGSIHRYIPFYEIYPDEIQAIFDFFDAGVSVENEMVFIYPTGLRPVLQLNQSPASIASKGLNEVKSYILIGNIVFVALLMACFVLVCLYGSKVISGLRHWFNKLKKIFGRLLDLNYCNQELRGITPLKILFMTFLVLTWILGFLPSETMGGIKLFRIIIIITNIVFLIYISKGIGFSKK